jgi:CDP-diacylglycerol---glycerol-3-phosphate 3-phosphatidyltransferase
MPVDNWWNIPNALTVSRIPLTVLFCYFVHTEAWIAGLVTFVVAAATDWVDGWWARKFNQLSAFGRTFDPLTDKILLGSAFIFFIPVSMIGVQTWMVAVVIGRELLITGVRGYVESLGKKFGADWFGKLKTTLQCTTVISCLVVKSCDDMPFQIPLLSLHYGILYATLAATVLSGLQYLVKAVALLGEPPAGA